MSALAQEAPVFKPGVVDDYFAEEMRKAEAATRVERDWTENLAPFTSDEEILLAEREGRLMRVSEGVGFLTRQTLREWSPERSDPEHEFYYSPNLLQPKAVAMLGLIGHLWSREHGWEHRLSVTSMIRSLFYQVELASRPGKLTINPEVGWSSHVFGYAFDIDACGLFIAKPDGTFTSANPRMSDTDLETRNLSQETVRNILGTYKDRGEINFVEEFPGTTNHCFHVCVKP